jgi:hypothetical protein
VRRLLLLTGLLLSCRKAPLRSPTLLFSIHAGGRTIPAALWIDPDRSLGFVSVGEGPDRYATPVQRLWTAMAADLDGDGDDEVLLGIWSTTHRHDEPEPHRTVWVMKWDGRALVPSWRGSALSRPLLDARVTADRPALLDALERDFDGKCLRTTYHWLGFGFGAIARRPERCPS